MYKIELILGFVAFSAVVFCPACGSVSELKSVEESLFDQWKIKHGKSYDAESDEHKYRLTNFARNLQRVIKHNAEDHSWKMDLNQFSDMTFHEFKNTVLMSPQNCSATNTQRVYASPVPHNMDWRKEGNFVTPVKNQESCGSCWTFSTTGCLESVTAIAGKPLYTLSEQQLIDCANRFDTHGCEGGLPSHAFEYIKYNGGLMEEGTYPYRAKDGSCHFDQSLAVAFVKDIVNITHDDEDSIVNAVGTLNPVSVAFDVADDFMQYKSGIYSSTKCGKLSSQVNHAVLAVGYDSKGTDKPYWIIKNSWGASWGIDGYFHMERGTNMCGIATCASYPVVV